MGAKIKVTIALIMQYFEWARVSSLIVTKREENNEDEDSVNCDNLLGNADLLSASIRAEVATFTVVVGLKGSGKSEALALAMGGSDLGHHIDSDRLKRVSD